jgi:hypothetical protein
MMSAFTHQSRDFRHYRAKMPMKLLMADAALWGTPRSGLSEAVNAFSPNDAPRVSRPGAGM